MYHHNTHLSTGPPRPPGLAGRGSWLLLVSGSREKVYKNKGELRGPGMLSAAAKLKVVAGRDLVGGEKTEIMLMGEK